MRRIYIEKKKGKKNMYIYNTTETRNQIRLWYLYFKYNIIIYQGQSKPVDPWFSKNLNLFFKKVPAQSFKQMSFAPNLLKEYTEPTNQRSQRISEYFKENA